MADSRTGASAGGDTGAGDMGDVVESYKSIIRQQDEQLRDMRGQLDAFRANEGKAQGEAHEDVANTYMSLKGENTRLSTLLNQASR